MFAEAAPSGIAKDACGSEVCVLECESIQNQGRMMKQESHSWNRAKALFSQISSRPGLGCRALVCLSRTCPSESK